MTNPILLRLLALFLLPLAIVAVRTPLRRRFLSPPDPRQPSRNSRPAVEAMAAVLSRLPRRFTCLERAAALHRLLRWTAYPSVLRIGIRPEGSGIAAHAWVEDTEGVPLLDEESGAYQPLQPALDPPPRRHV